MIGDIQKLRLGLNAARANGGGVVELQSGATYRLDDVPLSVTGVPNLRLIGHEAELVTPSIAEKISPCVYGKDVRGLTIDGLHIRGEGELRGPHAGVIGVHLETSEAVESGDVTIRNCIAHNAMSIARFGNKKATECGLIRRVSMLNCKADRCGYGFHSLYGVQGLTVVGLLASDCQRTATMYGADDAFLQATIAYSPGFHGLGSDVLIVAEEREANGVTLHLTVTDKRVEQKNRDIVTLAHHHPDGMTTAIRNVTAHIEWLGDPGECWAMSVDSRNGQSQRTNAADIWKNCRLIHNLPASRSKGPINYNLLDVASRPKIN